MHGYWSGFDSSLARCALIGAWIASGCADRESDGGEVAARDAAAEDAAAPSDASAEPALDGLRVRLAAGEIEGSREGATRRFMGIPFAAPPLGERRWQPPAAVDPWPGVLAATVPARACPQATAFGALPDTSEDCLHLNVWTPDPLPEQPVPVMVWLHGGANTSGSASTTAPGSDDLLWDGRRLIEASPTPVIVVTVSYRLGWLGFLVHRGLVSEQGSAGNYGLMDQRAALEWVRDNIADFGGDPDRVTLFGQSAGAQDALLLLASPSTQGLFQRVIAESPPFASLVEGYHDLEQRQADGDAWAERVGCTQPAATDALDCLRALPASELLFQDPLPILPGGALYQERVPRPEPVVGDAFLPDWPLDALARGERSDVAVIIGTTASEGAYFHQQSPPRDESEYLAALARFWGEATAEAIAAHYPATDYPSPNDALAQVTSEGIFVCPSRRVAHELAERAPTFVYEHAYDYVIPLSLMNGITPGTHGSELGLVWNGVDADPAATANDRMLMRQLVGSFTRFASTGDPGGGVATFEWPRYAAPAFEELVIDAPARTRVQTDRERERCAFWSSLQ
jgi:para-nitrobenzyl esterase